MRLAALLTVGLLSALACAAPSAAPRAPVDGIVQVTSDYTADRKALRATLTLQGPSPQGWEKEPLPKGIRAVTYPADPGPMKGWIWPAAGPGPHPVVVFFHGGFAWGVGDLTVCEPFVRAGYTVFTPALRGENGNPGLHEHYLGEVDDAAAAVRWIATQPDVDVTRIYTFGHSAGGVISGMMSLIPDLPVVKTGSAGGVYPERAFDASDFPYPFDTTNVAQRRIRGFVHYLGSMRRPHHAWVGEQDWLAQFVPELKADAAETRAPLSVHRVAGDHFTSFEAAMTGFLGEIEKK